MEEIDPAEPAGPQPNVGSPSRRPLLATLVGSACVLVTLARPREAISDDFDERLVFALGLAAAPVLIVGVATYAITLRQAPITWKIGSLAIILLVAIFAGFVQSSGWLVGLPQP